MIIRELANQLLRPWQRPQPALLGPDGRQFEQKIQPIRHEMSGINHKKCCCGRPISPCALAGGLGKNIQAIFSVPACSSCIPDISTGFQTYNLSPTVTDDICLTFGTHTSTFCQWTPSAPKLSASTLKIYSGAGCSSLSSSSTYIYCMIDLQKTGSGTLVWSLFAYFCTSSNSSTILGPFFFAEQITDNGLATGGASSLVIPNQSAICENGRGSPADWLLATTGTATLGSTCDVSP